MFIGFWYLYDSWNTNEKTLQKEKYTKIRVISPFNPFRTAVSLWGQTTQISSSLSPKRSPKRDCGSKGVKVNGGRMIYDTRYRLPVTVIRGIHLCALLIVYTWYVILVFNDIMLLCCYIHKLFVLTIAKFRSVLCSFGLHSCVLTGVLKCVLLHRTSIYQVGYGISFSIL